MLYCLVHLGYIRNMIVYTEAFSEKKEGYESNNE